MESHETFEDQDLIHIYRAAYAPPDAATLSRVRERLALAVQVVPRLDPIEAEGAALASTRNEKSAASGSYPRLRFRGRRMLLALSLSAVIGVPAAYAATTLWGEIMPDRNGTAIQQFRQQHPYKSTTFVEQPAPEGMISRDNAVAASIPHAYGATTDGNLKPNVQVTARFGQYSSTMFLARPVWMVTFSGPDVAVYAHGRSAGVAREVTVIVDGRTGQYMEAHAGSSSLGTP